MFLYAVIKKVHITPRVNSATHDIWESDHATLQVQLEDQSEGNVL